MELVEKLFEESQKSLDDGTRAKLAKIESKADKVLEWMKLCIHGREIIREIATLIKTIPLN